MEKKEMIKKLMEKVNVTESEAKEALEKCNYDILDAIIYLERKEKEAKEVKYVDLAKNNTEEENKEGKKGSSIGETLGRFFKFIGKLIKKGNENYFEIKSKNEKPLRITMTISIILLVIAFWPVAILLVVGLFLGYKYSIVGDNTSIEKVNDVFDKAANVADDIKEDFRKGYNN